jgi:hypothetical protein
MNMPTEIPAALLEIHAYSGEGYRPLVDFGAWRVAVLRYIDELLPENINRFQRHDETDEVFVLLSGRCILFLGEGAESIERLLSVDLEPLKIYNVKRGCWHSHVLSQEASVLVIENQDTSEKNSPEIELNRSQKEQIMALTNKTWQDDSPT